jgi:hypothetical protein
MIEIKVFLTFFCLLMEGSGSRSRSGSVQNMMDPNADPQHWLKHKHTKSDTPTFKIQDSAVDYYCIIHTQKHLRLFGKKNKYS